jgi:hypothetical protein
MAALQRSSSSTSVACSSPIVKCSGVVTFGKKYFQSLARPTKIGISLIGFFWCPTTESAVAARNEQSADQTEGDKVDEFSTEEEEIKQQNDYFFSS